MEIITLKVKSFDKVTEIESHVKFVWIHKKINKKLSLLFFFYLLSLFIDLFF